MQEPEEKPQGEHHGKCQDETQRTEEEREEGPVAPGVAARLAEVALQKEIVAAVGLPCDIKCIAEHGNGANEHTDTEVNGHSDESDIGNSARPGSEWNDEREQASERVAEAGNETDEAVDSEAKAGSGNAERFVEQDFEGLQGAVAEEPCAAGPAFGGVA